MPLVEGVSSTRIRDLLRAGEVDRAAGLLGRPAEVVGTVVAGDARGGTLGFPTANLRPEPGVLVPGYGIYAGAADGHRAAISIGTNPHYGGGERRIEAFLLDFTGDLYGKRLTLELWQRLRDERAFESEAELVAQIDRDVEATRRGQRPALEPQVRDRRHLSGMEQRTLTERRELVRCLDCGTEYRLPRDVRPRPSRARPAAASVGWRSELRAATREQLSASFGSFRICWAWESEGSRCSSRFGASSAPASTRSRPAAAPPRESRLSRVRLPGVVAGQRAGAAAAPLRRGSPAAPARVTALTPPK